jgi:hypothetical protein
MPEIPNFPDDLLHQHHKWHMPAEHPELPPMRLHPAGSTGSGIEFLVFHRDFMAQVMAWYNTTPFTVDPFDQPAQKAALVAPWTSVPAELRAAPVDKEWKRWENDAARLDSAITPGPTRPSDFDSPDELGIFIELRIHNSFLHGAAAIVYNDDLIGPQATSPLSTLFYKIHGLVQHWWSIWARRYALRGSPSLTFDPNRPLERLIPPFGAGSPIFHPGRHAPTLSMETSEPKFDPREVESLKARVRLLEERTLPMSIKTTEGHYGKAKGLLRKS